MPSIDTSTAPVHAADDDEDTSEEFVELAGSDISFEDDNDDEEADADESTDDEVATESEDETAADSETDADETTDEAEAETEQSDDADAPDEAALDTAAEERKRHNDEMAKARIAERQARDEAKAARKAAEDSDIERYLSEVRDDTEQLKQRELDVREYRITQQAIEINDRALETEVKRAYAEIELFKTGTPAVQERLARALDRFEASNITTDKQGRPVEVRGSVYQYLQDEAAAIAAEREELRAEILGTQNKSKSNQKARTLTPPVKSPVKSKVDPDLEAFDEEARSY